MNIWETLLTPRLADYYVLATVFLAAVALALKCTAQPARRIVIAWAAMGGLLLLLVLCFLPGWARFELPRFAGSNASQYSPAPIQPRALRAPTTRSSTPRAADMPTAPLTAPGTAAPIEIQPAPAVTLPSISTIVQTTFLSGMLAVAAWLAWGGVQTLLLCRRAAPTPRALRTVLADVADPADAPRLLVSRKLRTAVALGVLRPKILLSAQLLERLDDADVRAILVHEWGHIRNQDLRLLAISRWLLLLLFPHPLFWYVRMKMRDDQETLADAVVVNTIDRRTYAEQLLDWARAGLDRPGAGLARAIGIWERPSQLSRRIVKLLDDEYTIPTQCSGAWRRALTGALLALAVLLSVFTLRPLPAATTPADLAGSADRSLIDEALNLSPRATLPRINDVALRIGIYADPDVKPLPVTIRPPSRRGKKYVVPKYAVPDLWWAVGVSDTNSDYLTESGFTVDVIDDGVRASAWRLNTTARRGPTIDLPVGRWYALEIKFHDNGVDGHLGATHNIYAPDSKLLYSHTMSTLFLNPPTTRLAGLRYSWFTNFEPPLNRVFIWTDPSQYFSADMGVVVNVAELLPEQPTLLGGAIPVETTPWGGPQAWDHRYAASAQLRTIYPVFQGALVRAFYPPQPAVRENFVRAFFPGRLSRCYLYLIERPDRTVPDFRLRDFGLLVDPKLPDAVSLVSGVPSERVMGDAQLLKRPIKFDLVVREGADPQAALDNLAGILQNEHHLDLKLSLIDAADGPKVQVTRK